MEHSGTLWANRISVVAGKRCSTALRVTATLAVDTGVATVTLEHKGEALAIDAGDLAWMFQSWTCYCCGIRERKLLVSAATPKESREAFDSKYSTLRSVESGEDTRQKARLLAAMTNGDVLCIGMRCGNKEEQHEFIELCQALIKSADMVVCQEASSSTRRRRCSSTDKAVPESSAVVDEAQANQHMEELLAELEIEDACKAAKARRKNRQKRCNQRSCRCPDEQCGIEQQCQDAVTSTSSAIAEEAETKTHHQGFDSDEDVCLAAEVEQKQTDDDPVKDTHSEVAQHARVSEALPQHDDIRPLKQTSSAIVEEAETKTHHQSRDSDEDVCLAAEVEQKQTDDDPVEEPHSKVTQRARVSEALLRHDDIWPPKQANNDAVEKPRSEAAQHAANSEAHLQHYDIQTPVHELGSDSISSDGSAIREFGHGQDVVQPPSNIQAVLQDELVSLAECPVAIDLSNADIAQSVSREQPPIGKLALTSDDLMYALQLGDCHQFAWWGWSVGDAQTADDIQKDGRYQPQQTVHDWWWQATDTVVGSEIPESWQLHPPMEVNATRSYSTSRLNAEPLKISFAGAAVARASSHDSREPVRVSAGYFKSDPLKVVLNSSPKYTSALHDDASSYSSEYTRCCESGDCCSSKLDALSPAVAETFSASLFEDIEQLDEAGLHTEIMRTTEHLRKLHMLADQVRRCGSSDGSVQSASDLF